MPVSAAVSTVPSRGQVLDELDQVLNSEAFRYSYRMCRLLRFLVEHALEHPARPMKERLLAVEVFDKPETFDARTDPIVRVEASRLRAKLRAYYHHEGAHHRVFIHLPSRGYRPLLTLHRARAESAGPPARTAAPRRPEIPAALDSTPSLLVLPFLDLSAGRSEEYFCDGLAEELINLLARVQGLRVIARSTAFRFKDAVIDIREIGERLQVSAILEGSVRREGDVVRVSVQLLNAAGGFHLWSATYERPARNVFSIQDEIARAIVDALRLKLRVPAGARTEDGAASHLYLRGLHAWHRRTGEGFVQALTLLRKAAAEAPGDARIHSKLAHCRIGLLLSAATASKEALRLAEEASARALALDPGRGEALAARAIVTAVRDWRWQDCESEFEAALGEAPGDPAIREWYAVFCLAPLGRFDDAIAQLGRALDEDPVSVSVRCHLGVVYYLQRRYREAARELELALDLEPDFHRGRFDLGMLYTMMCRHDEALEAFTLARSGTPESAYRLGAAAYGLARAGRQSEARALLERMRGMPPGAHVSGFCLAQSLIGLGDAEGALAMLERAMRERAVRLVWLRHDPVFDPLRGDPRLEKICRSMAL